MNFNEFNSKINLPEVCRIFGIKNLEFVKIPKFGWFAYNQKLTQIVHLFQLFPDKELLTLFKKFTIDMPDVQEFAMFYSERSEKTLYKNYAQLRMWHMMFKDAVHEAESAIVHYNKRDLKLPKLMSILGHDNLMQNVELGVVTSKLIKKYNKIEWPAESLNKLIVPTYCTPKHICSYHLVCPSNLNIQEPLFLNEEQGFVGELLGTVVPTLKDLSKEPGFIWDKKADFWTRLPIELSDKLSTGECIKIWLESTNTFFKTPPLDIIKKNNKQEELLNYLDTLNYQQLKELEANFNIPLLKQWKDRQESQVAFGSNTFQDCYDSYYLVNRQNGVNTQFTNFTIKLTHILKVEGKFYRKGFIRFQGKEVPFLIPEEAFSSAISLYKYVRQFFLEHGLGLPVILSSHKKYLLDIVERFNQNVVIEKLNTTDG